MRDAGSDLKTAWRAQITARVSGRGSRGPSGQMPIPRAGRASTLWRWERRTGSRSPGEAASTRRDILRARLWAAHRSIGPGCDRSSAPASTARSQIVGDLALCAPTCLHQPNRLGFELCRKSSLSHHGVPRPSVGTLHFSEASPGQAGVMSGCTPIAHRGR